ncbi:hypothetical protein ACFV0T_12980 [Streptomyces sp. NPDC059582]|uniref:hypothetical protein n=1 Tax=Streptomyces sp. NPDC059582 TaxID=3346875 RepID=UPI0036A567B9
MNRRSVPIVAAIAAAAALSLSACAGHDAESAKHPSKSKNIAEIKAALSAELHTAIKAATPKADYPKDEFGKAAGGSGCSGTQSTVRIAGWDPDEAQSNEELLTRSTAYLGKHGWTITPQVSDSEDQAAKIAKADLAEGLLTAANQGLTFEGDTVCSAP